MPDDLDRAQTEAEEFLNRALAASRGILLDGEASEFCEDCGECIPEPRRMAYPGCTRCVSCQQDVENRK